MKKIDGSRGGLRGKKPLKFFQMRVFYRWFPDGETSIGVFFLDTLWINHFLHSDRGEHSNIQSLVCFNLGSPNVFISLKMKLLISTFLYKIMVLMLHKPHVSI